MESVGRVKMQTIVSTWQADAGQDDWWLWKRPAAFQYSAQTAVTQKLLRSIYMGRKFPRKVQEAAWNNLNSMRRRLKLPKTQETRPGSEHAPEYKDVKF